jgi:hypothetical protein
LTVQSNNKTIPSGCQGWDWPDGLGERWASAPSGDSRGCNLEVNSQS